MPLMAKASIDPSGDHVGAPGFCSSPSSVARTCPSVPSASMTDMVFSLSGFSGSPVRHALRVPSGDQAGVRRVTIRSSPLPPSSTKLMSGEALCPVTNAIRASSGDAPGRGGVPPVKALTANARPATATASAIPATDNLRRKGGSRNCVGSRLPSSGQSSGGRTRVSARKWSSRLGIVGPQQFAETPSGAGKVYVDGRRRRSEDLGNFLRRITDRVVQDHGGPLLLRELGKRHHQVPCEVVHLVGVIHPHRHVPSPVFQFPCGDPEDRSPDPPFG